MIDYTIQFQGEPEPVHVTASSLEEALALLGLKAADARRIKRMLADKRASGGGTKVIDRRER